MFLFSKWIRISFLNLLIVALCGVILRYKIVFSLPIIEQKHLLHAHSHFAFTGWITQTIFCFLVFFLQKKNITDVYAKYKWLLIANLISAYGMLISFIIQGYALYSITFSTISIIVLAIFAVYYWRDLNRYEGNTLAAFCCKAALIFAQISSLATFMLAWLMVNKFEGQYWYVAAIYFFLHFQYNGWFFFGCLAILFMMIPKENYNSILAKKLCVTLVACCVPAYLLSVINFAIPAYAYAIAIITGIVQCVALFWLLFLMRPALSVVKSDNKWIFKLVAAALAIKFLLQMFSTIPALSILAFGSRPIIVGYLHLVLLCIISLFLLGASRNFLNYNSLFKIATVVFVIGIIANEAVLMSQGLMGFYGIPMRHVIETLFVITMVIFTGLLLLNIAMRKVTSD
ncbi:hypothetical protein [Pinibacter aurantiacus]|uniref:Uncharacterized protein n=1 Tax=Pinibacter aurantiacus TaxID=2851599 RepID=A0A9E2W7B5_9BACT|nr:hypothetical protein [Pinibacter aurantiacus]MBV4356341.1 hypothetical protein [Pinibacter aurantiacus]